MAKPDVVRWLMLAIVVLGLLTTATLYVLGADARHDTGIATNATNIKYLSKENAEIKFELREQRPILEEIRDAVNKGN